MELKCRFCREVYAAGGLVTAYLSLLEVCIEGADVTVTVQAQGHLHADSRWVKMSPATFLNNAAFPLDQSVHSPKVPPSMPATAQCIFATPREVVSRSLLLREGSGAYVQFDLPLDVLPSFKGLCVTTNYNIAVTVQSPALGTKHLFFPFLVTGRGSASIPYLIKFSSLSTFSAASLPADNVLVPSMAKYSSAEGGDDGEDDEELRMSQVRNKNSDIYNIRDKQHICSLTLIRSGLHAHLQAGSNLTVRLCFDDAAQQQGAPVQQLCRNVRARLLQCERRIDKTRVQEKALSCATRSTRDASVCCLHLHLPETSPCSFKCPLSEVNYMIEMEFFLGSEDDEDQPPFSWSLPVEVVPPAPALSSVIECNLCLEPPLEICEEF